GDSDIVCGAQVLPGHHHGPADKEVRKSRRINVRNCHAAPVNVNVSQRGVTDAIEEISHDFACAVPGTKIRNGPATYLRHSFQQVSINGRADAETEHSGTADSTMQLRKNVPLITDIAIRQERDEAKPGRVVRKVESGPDPFDHLRASGAIEAFQV